MTALNNEENRRRLIEDILNDYDLADIVEAIYKRMEEDYTNYDDVFQLDWEDRFGGDG